MKRNLWIVTVALSLWSCSQDKFEADHPALAYDPSKIVTFVTHVDDDSVNENTTDNGETRGMPITAVSQMTDMGVYCSATALTDWTTSSTLNKMFNRKITLSSGKWVYTAGEEEEWNASNIDDRYTFFAYAPYAKGVYNASTNSSGNGIVVNGSTSTAGIPTVTYTVPTHVVNQPDLMVAKPQKNVRKLADPVTLAMQHALTCVGFQVAGNGELVTGISVTGVAVSGTLAMNGDAIAWSNLGSVTTTTDFSASLNYDAGKTYYTTKTDMSTNLIAGNGYLMMIPQPMTAAAKVKVTYSDGKSTEFPLNGTGAWAAGKKITYSINILPGGTITVAPDNLLISAKGTDGTSNNITVTCADADGNPDPTMEWTLTSNAPWLTLSLNQDGSQAATTISGTGNQTVYTFVGEYTSTTADRSTTITHNGTTVVTVKQLKAFNVTNSDESDDLAHYVGAFWRAEEMGERIIRVTGNTGAWTASVAWVDNSWSDGDIVLAAGGTADPRVTYNASTETPINNAESYPVTGNLTSISGTGSTILFRIGLKTKWNSSNAKYSSGVPARYAIVVLYYNNNSTPRRLFLRQGEEADYLMRNGDAPTVSIESWDGVRTMANKFSPYNLTAPQYRSDATSPVAGGTSIHDHVQLPKRSTLEVGAGGTGGGVFAEFPTQAGAYFLWGVSAENNLARRAFHPSNPPTHNIITDWVIDYTAAVWQYIGPVSETCPPGWHRPNNGPIDKGLVPPYSHSNAEMVQSLWLNPPSWWNSASNTENLVRGFYADGFFDRRAIVDPWENYGPCAVDIRNHIAYHGVLFYNPYTNASLFFPAAGERSYANGGLSSDRTCMYWTTLSGSLLLYITVYPAAEAAPEFAMMKFVSITRATSIRCVTE